MADQVTRPQLQTAISEWAEARAEAAYQNDQGTDPVVVDKAQRAEIAHREFLDAQLDVLFPDTGPIIP